MELLAPAGSMQALKAAVQSGADAVYFGTGEFNARAYAANFSGEDRAAQAISFCRERGKKAYIAINTLVLDKEITRAMDMASMLYRLGANAFIVQDIGLFSLLKSNFPDIELHFSTQACVHNLAGVREAEKMGASRVVLSRELPLEDIRNICNGSGVGIEVFAHGAMCASVSGLCLFSSFVDRRSGNRGTCAQPCRLTYTEGEKSGSLISMKDMCMIEHLQELRNAGVSCIKLEGRMKKPEYVATVTKMYREALDGGQEFAAYKAELYKAFNRDGFSTGYYFGNNDLFVHRDLRERSTFTDDEIKSIDRECNEQRIKKEIAFHFEARPGEKMRLSCETGEMSIEVVGEIAQPAVKLGLTEQKAREQLSKLQDTAYELTRFTAEIADNTFASLSELNALRRDAIKALSNRFLREKAHFEIPKFGAKRTEDRKAILIAQVMNTGQAKAALDGGADVIYALLTSINHKTLEEWEHFGNANTSLVLPPFLRDDELVRARDASLHFSSVVISNISQAGMQDIKMYGSHELNITNAHTAHDYIAKGLDRITLSVELNLPQIRDIINTGVDCEIVVYGKVPLMSFLQCQGDCKNCCRELTDRTGRTFKAIRINYGHCMRQILNSVPIDTVKLADDLKELNAAAWKMLFYDEGEDAVFERTRTYRNILDGKRAVMLEGSSGGHYRRGFI